jgi:hypothetical protein
MSGTLFLQHLVAVASSSPPTALDTEKAAAQAGANLMGAGAPVHRPGQQSEATPPGGYSTPPARPPTERTGGAGDGGSGGFDMGRAVERHLGLHWQWRAGIKGVSRIGRVSAFASTGTTAPQAGLGMGGANGDQNWRATAGAQAHGSGLEPSVLLSRRRRRPHPPAWRRAPAGDV